MIYLIIIIWLALGIHSAWYMVRQYTKIWDFKMSEIITIVICVLLPIVTHIATFFTYHLYNINEKRKKEDRVIFHKR